MSFEYSFSSHKADQELLIDDDDRVCYAYLFDSDGSRLADVWLYNRVAAPNDFDDARHGLPPRNPTAFVADTKFPLPTSPEEFSIQWWHEGDTYHARVFIRDKLVAILAPGTIPGWSAMAKKDGPVAKVLIPSSSTNIEEIIHEIRTLNTPKRDREHGDVMEEMTATDHRGRENFKAHHRHPERRLPKDERRRIRMQHRVAWSRDWNEGRYDHLPRLGPSSSAGNSAPRRSSRPLTLPTGASLDEVLQAIADELPGSTATDEDIRQLRARFPAALVPEWLANALRRYRLAGTNFDLTEAQDLSGLGADVRWLPVKQMIGEACDLEPGFTVVRSGFIPFGGCAIGTGDPFFFDMRGGSQDPPVVRVPHDYAGGETYPLDAIELVSSSLSGFLKTATIV